MEKPWLSAYDPGVPASIAYPEVPVHGPMLASAARDPSAVALAGGGGPVTYGELASRAVALSRSLNGLGVGRGARVGIVLPNIPEMAVSYYAISMTGATAVMLSPRLVAREFDQMAADAGLELLICFGEFYRLMAETEALRRLDRVVVVGTGGPPGPGGGAALEFDSLVGEGGPPFEAPAIDPRDDVAVLIYTGGTTGIPKAVMLTHYALVANAMQLGAWVDLHPGCPAICALPLFHSYGMSTGLNAPLFHGATSVLVSGEEAGELVEGIERHRVKLLVGVPSTVEDLVDYPGIEDADLSSLEYVFVGAAPLPGKVRKKFNRISTARLLEGYGLTEAVTAQAANPRLGAGKPGSIGLPFPDVAFRVVDLETGTRDLGPEKAGELLLSSPCVMKGYHRRPVETAKVLREGWLATGDVAWVDRDGYFYVIDRKKDMVTSGVFKAYPAEVEAVINAHGKVRESAVVGLFDDFRGHSLKALVVLEEPGSMTERELLDYLEANLSRHKVPRVVEFRDRLPKSDLGKILRTELE